MTGLIISREYHLDSKTVSTAFIKKYFTEHLVKTLIQAALFFIMGAYFTANFILTGDKMSIFLFCVCFAFVLVVFLNPILTAKSESKVFGRGVYDAEARFVDTRKDGLCSLFVRGNCRVSILAVCKMLHMGIAER